MCQKQAHVKYRHVVQMLSVENVMEPEHAIVILVSTAIHMMYKEAVDANVKWTMIVVIDWHVLEINV